MHQQEQKTKTETASDAYRDGYRHGIEAMRVIAAEALRSSYDAGAANLVLILPEPELER